MRDFRIADFKLRFHLLGKAAQAGAENNRDTGFEIRFFLDRRHGFFQGVHKAGL